MHGLRSSPSHNCARPSYAAVAVAVEEDDSEKHEENLDDDGDTACWANDNNFGTVGRVFLRKYQKISHSQNTYEIYYNTCRSKSAEMD